ncbi:hypothetical protein [Fibrobacter intestinalis]|uniref:GIY-YIG domain-containing protein n=1 Tax=Fibrobacter intestinalis TaxID=28122 RepID=A0A1T4PC54_9BACT|nr:MULTISPECIES: hypothetical protein [Fibrobacter]PBC75088.1 hypothetical protein BGW94_2771 [Fibrobacter sp. NR9]SJZ89104.1 hypothetical protein SAMN02745108_01873 [Fibrobacter intestinalis]
MSVNFTIHGPFDVPTEPTKIKGGKITIQQLGDVGANLWRDKNFSKYADKKGCYVFVNAVTRGSKPIYVGRTNRKFKSECFATAKKAMLNEFLAGASKTGLKVYFVSIEHRKDCSDEIDLCETLLISQCKKANRNLLNVKKLTEKFTIKSFHGDTNRPTKDVAEFKKCLNLK